jgi:hypothetical protein
VTDRLSSYGAAMKVIGILRRQECGRLLNNRAENPHQPLRRREGAVANSRTSGPCRNLPPFTPQSRTTSIKTATSTSRHLRAETLGGSGRVTSACGLRSLAPGVLETSSHWTNSTPEKRSPRSFAGSARPRTAGRSARTVVGRAAALARERYSSESMARAYQASGRKGHRGESLTGEVAIAR